MVCSKPTYWMSIPAKRMKREGKMSKKTILQLRQWTSIGILLWATAWMSIAGSPRTNPRTLRFAAGSTSHLAVRDGYVYVLNAWSRGDGILVFDFREPEAPRFAGGLPARGYHSRPGAFAGDVFYIPATTFSAQAVDVSDPENIRTLRNLFYNFPAGDVQCLTASGDRLFVGGRGGGLHILDISDPRAPVPTVWQPEYGHLAQIAVEGRRIILRPHRGDAIVGALENDRVVEHARLRLSDIQWFGHALYETTSQELIVRDLSDLSEPKIVWRRSGTSPIGMVREDQLLMRVPENRLAVFDISDPLNPQPLREIAVPEDIGLDRMAIENGILYSFDADRVSVRSYDITGEQVRPLGESFIMRNSGHLALGEGTRVFLSYAQGANTTVFSLDTRNVGPADFSNPMFQTLPSSDNVFGMHDVHRAAAVRRVRSWLLQGDGVYDLSNPKDPRLVHPTTRVASDIAVRNDVAALAQSDRVTFMDVSKLPERVMLSVYAPDQEDTHYTGVALGASYAYLVNAGREGSRVEVLDIRTPREPKLVGHCETPAALKAALYESEGLLYLPASAGGCISVLDVSDPESPRLLKTVDDLLEIRGYWIEVHDGRLYYSDSMRGIKVADLTDPRNPALIKTYVGATTHSADYTDFEIRDNRLYGLRFSHLDIWDIE